ncbi:hypothetical protein C7N43_00160 [Sphingobacteriales bacterium UPWRP_1]|nr:hypothetical protein BVG80_15090 [Sphingobacteriales bacterium TSM_CSM]PSJ79074.1 hypothetical protein C7N43_00160 [Sphingobacteriales bacterium UPWRP_1]
MGAQLLTPQHTADTGVPAVAGATAQPNSNQHTTSGIQNTHAVAEEDNSNSGVFAGMLPPLYAALPPFNRLIGCGG